MEMKLFKVTFNGSSERYIVAKDFAQAEEIWNSDIDRYKIQSLILVSDDLLMISN
jgi:hypothetical protein